MQDFGVSNRLPIVRPRLLVGACAVSAIALLSAAPAALAAVIHVVDVIPNGASAETGQNSEPSLAVDPLDPTQMISGTFSSSFVGNQVTSPFWKSTNGGTTWSGFGSLTSVDKSLAWRQDGVAALAVTQTLNNGLTQPSSSTPSKAAQPILALRSIPSTRARPSTSRG